MPARYPIVARQGWLLLTLLLAVGIAIGLSVGWPAAMPVLALALVLAWLFRDPPREVPSLPLAVVCPADGRVLQAGEAHDPYLDRPARHVELALSPVGSYVVRSPIEGNITERWYRDQDLADAVDAYAVSIRTDEDDEVVVEMRRQHAWQGLSCHAWVGERVGQGQRCGFLRFGARLCVYLPAGCHLEVEPGQRVKSGRDVLATLVHRSHNPVEAG